MRLYKLREIKFNDFLEYLLDGDLSKIGDGYDLENPSSELIEHGISLRQEFEDMISSSENEAAISLNSEIMAYNITLETTQMIIDVLKLKYDYRLCEILIEDGFNFEFSEESYLNDLEKVVMQCKSIVIMRDDLLSKYEELNGESKPATYEYYDNILNAISQMVKYNVDGTLSTTRIAKYYAQLLKYIEKKETLTEDGGREY